MNPNYAILFGGANGNNTKFEIKNDTYLFQIKNCTWIKIYPKGDLPSPRAVHSACPINEYNLAIFGGTDQNGVVPDDLYILNISQYYNNYTWNKLINDGQGPGSRYGHTIIYKKPYLLILGGNLETNYSNQVHYALIDENNIYKKIKWNILKIANNSQFPSPRIYQTCSICKYGNNSDMIFLFGGRDKKGMPLNDCWVLKNIKEKWEWEKIPYRNGYEPQKRFQHTAIFFYNFLIVIGGRTLPENQQINIEIFDTNSYKWEKSSFFNRFRHTNFLSNNFLYVHGGFDPNNPDCCQNDIIQIDLIKLFNNNDLLKNKLDESKNKVMKKTDDEKIFQNQNKKDSLPEKEKNIKQMMKLYVNQNIFGKEKDYQKIINQNEQVKSINEKNEKKPNEKEKKDFIGSKRHLLNYKNAAISEVKLHNSINLKITSVDQKILFFITCKKDDKFYSIEEKLYEKYPEYIESENYFMVNGSKINKMKTLLQNKIKNGDKIILKKIEDDD